MLVLSRKLNETICVGPDITIKVIRVNGGRVRLAIEAPDNVRIQRGELLEKPTPCRESADGSIRRTASVPLACDVV